MRVAGAGGGQRRPPRPNSERAGRAPPPPTSLWLPDLPPTWPPGKVVCEEPNSRLHHFVGCLEWNGRKHPLDIGNVLLRGCKVRNTDTCYGLVIYAGAARGGPGGGAGAGQEDGRATSRRKPHRFRHQDHEELWQDPPEEEQDRPSAEQAGGPGEAPEAPAVLFRASVSLLCKSTCVLILRRVCGPEDLLLG